MEVRIFSSSGRPGVGQPPKREAQRPLLPQHARHCPVLEAGSALGFLVYPPLEPNEAAHITYEGEGRYTCGFFVSARRRHVGQGLHRGVRDADGQHRRDARGGRVQEADHHRRERRQHGQGVPRAAGPGHAAGRDRAARRHQLPDARRLGHGLHADLQHDRAPGGADADRARRDRLVRARHRVPLRAAAGRGDEPQPHAADRPGGVRAARGGHAARRHRRGARRRSTPRWTDSSRRRARTSRPRPTACR